MKEGIVVYVICKEFVQEREGLILRRATRRLVTALGLEHEGGKEQNEDELFLLEPSQKPEVQYYC